MAEQGPEGYHGEIRERLRRAGAQTGNLLRVTSKDGKSYEGYLIPRSEYDDHGHIVLKLRNGYNVGIHFERTEKIEKIGEGEKPRFTQSPPISKKAGLPKVSIISTGGTIASRVDYRTGAVEPALSAQDLVSVIPELSSIAEIDTRILFSEYSENLTPAHWKRMAEEAAQIISHGVDGIVISHGTDTMHYSSAALSFALQNLPVPILFVGSQRSSDRPSSDAPSNLTGAVALASTGDFAGVGLAMHEGISDHRVIVFKGTRVRKCHTSRRDAFKSIETPPIAIYDLRTSQAEMFKAPLKRDKSRRVIVRPNFDPTGYLVKSYPGFDPRMIDTIVQNGGRGIILEGTGLGHVPKATYEPIRRAVKNDVSVFMTSQTIWGRVDMNVYYTGRDLLATGVVPLEDMLSETALVKLMWCLAQTKSPERVREMMLEPIAGEILSRTPDLEPQVGL